MRIGNAFIGILLYYLKLLIILILIIQFIILLAYTTTLTLPPTKCPASSWPPLHPICCLGRPSLVLPPSSPLSQSVPLILPRLPYIFPLWISYRPFWVCCLYTFLHGLWISSAPTHMILLTIVSPMASMCGRDLACRGSIIWLMLMHTCWSWWTCFRETLNLEIRLAGILGW